MFYIWVIKNMTWIKVSIVIAVVYVRGLDLFPINIRFNDLDNFRYFNFVLSVL